MTSPVLVASRCSLNRRGAAELLSRPGPVSAEPDPAFEAHLADLVSVGPDADAPRAYEWSHGAGGAAFDALCFLSSRAQQLVAAALAAALRGDDAASFHLARRGYQHAASALELRDRPDFVETPCSSHEHTSTHTFVRLGHALRGLQSLCMLRSKVDLRTSSGGVEGGPAASRAQALSRAADSAVRDLFYAGNATGWTGHQAESASRLCIEACFYRLAARAAWWVARDAPGDVGRAIGALREATAASPALPGVRDLLARLEDRNRLLMETVPDPLACEPASIDRRGYADIQRPAWLATADS